MALYRRYRPQRFQDVIGQEHVTRPIMAALRAGRTAHAYLFSGPRGCGKTTSARILARCLNCAQAPTDTPCGECESCRELSLAGGGSLDVVEMDAASHGGVDDARELIERAAFAPARDGYKIFIIDEAHMVSNQGFNALLKLVEEPPDHVKFVFATTEPEKVIGTIRSRTHHYPFRLVPPETLEAFMSGICADEGIEIGAGVLPLVVRAGGGSVRDSLSVLDQLIGGSEERALAYDQAIALLGFTDASLLDDAVEAVAARDGASLFAVVERVVQSGHDPRRFVEDLLQRLRDLIVVSLAGEQADDVLTSVPRDQYERMLVQAEHLGARGASRAADLTNDALKGMVGATSPRLQLELLCARLLLAEAGPPGGSPEAQAPNAGAAPQTASRGATSRAGAGGRDQAGEPESQAARSAPPVRPAAAQRQTRQAPRGGNPAAAGRRISPAWAAGSEGGRRPAAGGPVDAPGSAGANGSAPAGAGTDGASGSGGPDGPRAPAPAAAGVDRAAAAGADAPVPAGADASIVRQRWREIVAAVAQNSKSTAALIDSHAMVGAIRDGVLQLQFQTAGLATTFNDRGHSPRVSRALHDVLGVDVRVRGLVGGEAGPKDPAPRGATSASAPRAARAAARAKAPAAPPARGTAAPDAKGTPAAAAERATPPDTVPRQGEPGPRQRDPGPRREETSRSESGGDVRGGPDPRHKGTRPQRREPAPQETQPADRPSHRKAAPSKAAPAPRRENPPSSRAPIPPEAPPPDIPIPPYIPTEEDIPPEELEAAFSLPSADGFGASDAVKPGRDPAGVLAQLIDAPGVGASAHGGDDGVGESDGGKSGGGESRAAAQTGEGTAGADEADESEATAGTDPTAQTAELGDTAGEPAEAAGEATEADAGAGDARDAAALGSADGGPGRGEPGQAAKEDASPAAGGGPEQTAGDGPGQTPGGESGQAVKDDPGRDDVPFFAQRMPTPAPPPRQAAPPRQTQAPPPPTAPEAAAFPRPDRSPSPRDAVGSPDSPGPKGRGANGAQSIGDRIRATHGGGAPGGGVGSQPPAAGGGPDLRGRRPSQPGESPQRPAGKLGESAGTAPARPPSPAAAASEEDEVSDSDPAVSQSDLVGLNVVLSTFKGKVIEEIDKTSGGQ